MKRQFTAVPGHGIMAATDEVQQTVSEYMAKEDANIDTAIEMLQQQFPDEPIDAAHVRKCASDEVRRLITNYIKRNHYYDGGYHLDSIAIGRGDILLGIYNGAGTMPFTYHYIVQEDGEPVPLEKVRSGDFLNRRYHQIYRSSAWKRYA